MPYISASIILQLLTVVIPTLERLAKEGEAGRKKITQYNRAYKHDRPLGHPGARHRLRTREHAKPDGVSIVPTPGWGFRLLTR